MTKIPFPFSKHFDLTGNHTYFLRELVPDPQDTLFLLRLVYLHPFTIILDPPRYFNEIQEFTFFGKKKTLRETDLDGSNYNLNFLLAST